MANDHKYQEGQRWSFLGGIPEFENTLVIGRAIDAHPEWGWDDPTYEVYVRFSEAAKDHIPADYDGIILSLTDAAMDRSVQELVESGVELPWWWVYGRRFDRREDAPNVRHTLSCDRVSDVLKHKLASAKDRAEDLRERAEAIRKHGETFRSRNPNPAPSRSVAESWERIKAWYAEHIPDRPPSLAPGASEDAIADFETEIGATLPDEFKESVRIHDGGGWWVPWRNGDLLSLAQILAQWKMYSEWQAKGDYATDTWTATDFKGPIKPIFWNKKRIYVSDNSGNHLTLDLDPPPEGKYGQVLHHSHEVGPTEVVAESWAEFLSNLAVDLESGKYIYYPRYGELELLEYFVKE